MQLKKSHALLESYLEYSPDIDQYPSELLSNCKKVATSSKENLLKETNPNNLKYLFAKLRLCLPIAFSVQIYIPIKDPSGSIGNRFYYIKGTATDRWYSSPTYTVLVQPAICSKPGIRSTTVRKLLKSKRVHNNDDLLLF